MKNKKIILLSVLCIFLIIIENIIFSKLEDNYVTKKEVHIDEIKDYVVIDKLKVKEEYEPIILFGSDYQGDLRYTNSKELFEVVKRYITPNLFVVAGDYRVNMDDNYYESEKGIFELVLLFNDYFKDIPIITIQGNHDPYNTLVYQVLIILKQISI